MKTSRRLTLAVLAAAFTFTGAAHAQSGLTREQVKAELAQAQRHGDLIDYETGLRQNQLFPGAYPARSQSPVAVSQMPPTSAGPSETPATSVGRQAVRSTMPWDYEAISQRHVDALARGGRGH